MLYSRIAGILQSISQAKRGQKARILADFLKEIPPEMLCPAIRLIFGELWPSWEEREMGVGPEAILAALSEIADEEAFGEARRQGEMGLVAEKALQRKGQHSLTKEPLEAVAVYEGLRRISEMSGPDSVHRKNAVLRGLFLEALALEGKYIARTALRNMLAGVGPQTMISAVSAAFGCDPASAQRAYSLLPEPGLVARSARRGELDGIAMQPMTPVKSMIFRPGGPVLPGAFLPRYPGLRVQVHRMDGRTAIFSSRQSSITAIQNGLSIAGPETDMILDADLIGFHEGRMCSQAQMMRYLNRRRNSRRSSLSPALLAYDLLYLKGEDTTGLAYEERRRRLCSVLGDPKGIPFQGIAPAEEKVLCSAGDVDGYLHQVLSTGGRGLISRDLKSLYHPGGYSDGDFIMAGEETVVAVVVRAEFGRGDREGLLVRYQVALRSGDDLVPVGWAIRGLSRKEVSALSDHLQSLALNRDPQGVDVRPQVVLALKIAGACPGENGYRILRPVIEETRLDATLEEVEPLDRLEKICRG